jgi:hypothetical protein
MGKVVLLLSLEKEVVKEGAPQVHSQVSLHIRLTSPLLNDRATVDNACSIWENL